MSDNATAVAKLGSIEHDGVQSKSLENKPSNAFSEAYKFMADTAQNPNGRNRQLFVAADGLVVGGIKDIPNELCNHPLETVGKAAVAVAAGAGVAALLAVESPLIVAGTLVGGGVLLGVGLKNSWDKACNDRDLSNAMSATWKHDDTVTLINSMKVAENRLGPEGFDYGIGIAGGTVGAIGPRVVSRAIASKFGSKTVWGFYPPKNWVPQSDGTKVAFNGYKLSTQYPDGTIKDVMSTAPHSTSTFHPKGGKTIEYPNGAKVFTSNGTSEVTYPGGKRVTVDRFGDRTTELPNGTKIEETTDGNIFVHRKDGGFTRKDLNGDTYNRHANGDVHDVTNGKKTLYSASEKKYYRIKPDGEKVAIPLPPISSDKGWGY